MTILSVNDICTDADLVDIVGSRARLTGAVSDESRRDAFRAAALQDVVDALGSRTPPVFDSDLSFPTELKNAVAYRALHKIFLTGVAAEGDMHYVLARQYDKEYQAAVRSRFSVSQGVASPSGNSFSLERR